MSIISGLGKCAGNLRGVLAEWARKLDCPKNLLLEVRGARSEISPQDRRGLGNQHSTSADEFVNKFSSWVLDYRVHIGQEHFAEFCIWNFQI